MDTTVEVETLVNTLTEVYMSTIIGSSNVTDLVRFIKTAMEYTERITADGSIKRNIALRSVVTVIDRFVKDEKTKAIMKSMVPQIIDTVVDVSKKRWFINMKTRYKSCCF